MRLLNVRTLEFVVFHRRAPPYAIASHRWVGGEATYLDLLNGTNSTSAGYKKVLSFCEFVRSVGLRSSNGDLESLNWIWIDSCCIDRRSSAELSEAVASMGNWYTLASLCIAYLQDVRSLDFGINAVLLDFERSAWFGRGWTLQELIYPKRLVLTTCAWEIIGTKGLLEIGRLDGALGVVTSRCNDRREDLCLLLHQITYIPSDILNGSRQVSDAADDQKWSWLVGRETTRPEDMVYCMLGLFAISMPAKYGEGKFEARRRLEVAIREQRPRTDREPSSVSRIAQRWPGPDFMALAEPKINRWITEPWSESSDLFLFGARLCHRNQTNICDLCATPLGWSIFDFERGSEPSHSDYVSSCANLEDNIEQKDDQGGHNYHGSWLQHYYHHSKHIGCQ